MCPVRNHPTPGKQVGQRPVPPTYESASADNAEYACKYCTKNDAQITNKNVLVAAHQGAKTDGDDGHAGKANIATAINAVNASVTYALTQIAAYVLGHGDSVLSHTMVPYQFWPYTKMMLALAAALDDDGNPGTLPAGLPDDQVLNF